MHHILLIASTIFLLIVLYMVAELTMSIAGLLAERDTLFHRIYASVAGTPAQDETQPTDFK